MTIEVGRDELCRQDVKRMAELGRFGEEFVFYICAYQAAEGARYCVSEKPQQLYDLRARWLNRGFCPTPIEDYNKRFMLPSGMREAIKQQARIDFNRAYRERYPQRLAAALQAYGHTPPNNSAFALLDDLRRRWSGYFDQDGLRLYEGLVQQAYWGKGLTQQSYWHLRQWISRMWEQPGLANYPHNDVLRTFSAFAFEDNNGRQKVECGLPRYKLEKRREDKLMGGCLVTPVFTKSYWFREITQLNGVRRQFEQDAGSCLLGEYLSLVKALQALPSALDVERFTADMAQWTTPEAAAAWRGYGYLWRVWRCPTIG